MDLSTIESLGSKLGILPAMPHDLGTLACVYEDPADALPQIIPGLPLSRTMTIVGVVPSEKQPPAGAREIPMAGVTRAWFEQTLLWVVVDGWTLGVPSVMGSPDREQSAVGIAQSVIAWSR